MRLRARTQYLPPGISFRKTGDQQYEITASTLCSAASNYSYTQSRKIMTQSQTRLAALAAALVLFVPFALATVTQAALIVA